VWCWNRSSSRSTTADILWVWTKPRTLNNQVRRKEGSVWCPLQWCGVVWSVCNNSYNLYYHFSKHNQQIFNVIAYTFFLLETLESRRSVSSIVTCRRAFMLSNRQSLSISEIVCSTAQRRTSDVPVYPPINQTRDDGFWNNLFKLHQSSWFSTFNLVHKSTVYLIWSSCAINASVTGSSR
jgi:hypothetical protein